MDGKFTSTLGACHGFERRGGSLVFHGEITGENSAYRTQQPQKSPYVSGPDGLAPFGKCILLISYRYIKFCCAPIVGTSGPAKNVHRHHPNFFNKPNEPLPIKPKPSGS